LKNQLFKCVLTLLLLCQNLLCINLKAQEPFVQIKNNFQLNEFFSASNVVNYKLEDGLVSNHVYAISQDSLGYIWVATKAGLSRFNGNQFHNYTTKNGLHRNENLDLFRTESQKIWMSNNGPLGYIENGEINFLSPTIKQPLSWNYTAFERNDSLRMTLGTKFYLINLKTKTTKILDKESMVASSVKTTILGFYNNELFIHKENNIICYKNDSITRIIKIPINYHITHRYRLVCAQYNNGCFYVYEGRLLYFDFETKTTRAYNFFLEGILHFRIFDDKLFVTYNDGGFDIYQINANLDLELHTETKTDVIFTEIFKDKDSNYWAGTNTNGVFFFPKISDQITSRTSLNNVKLNALNCMYIDSDSLWLGTKKGDIILVNGDSSILKTLPFKNPNGETRIMDIKKISNHNFLISSDAGLFFMGKDGEIKLLFYAPLKKMSVVEDVIYVNIYFGTLKLDKACINLILNKIKSGNDSPKEIGAIIRDGNTCMKIIHNRRSHLTRFINSNEVFVYEPDTGLVYYTVDNDKFLNRKIIQDNIDVKDLHYFNNSLYIATIGEGLLRYNIHTNEIKSFSSLNSSSVYSLDLDTVTNIMYASSNEGINLIKLSNSGLEEYTLTIGKNKGLLSSEITEVMCADTCIVAISDMGINRLEKNFKINKKLPNFKIEQFKVNNTNLPLSDYYELEPDSNNITIAFNKIDFSNTINSTVVYKKNDDPWKKTLNNKLNFDDMEPGMHHLKLGLVFEQNELPGKVEELRFRIKQKFHQTVWAKLIAAIIIFTILFLAVNYYNTQKNLTILEEEVKIRTQQLSTNMQELDEVNHQLKTKNINLNSYTYLVSHDLKAPLYNISGFLNIISEKNKNKFDRKDKEYFGMVNTGLQSMLNKINDLLKYSKIVSDIDLSNIEPVNLNTIIREVKKDFKYEIENKSIQFVVEADLPKVKLEKTSAHILFQNLISNSIKYNQSKKPLIQIRAIRNKKGIVILVEDNGIGIKEAYKAEVFEIFGRGENSKAYEGTGIGLAMCKKIVTAHKGKIELNSEENVGTVLSLIFPKVS